MNINVKGKEYIIEYTFEAAYNKNCVDICWNHFSGMYMMKGATAGELNEEDSENKIAIVDKMVEHMSEVPRMAIQLFYAGLIENHGDEVKSLSDAKAIYKEFAKEHPDDPMSLEFGLMDAIKNQMEEDGFFKRIGLNQFMETMNNQEEMNQKSEKETTK